MLSDETLRALIEGILYVAPEPVSLDVIVKALESEERERVWTQLEALISDFERPEHGIQIREVAGGYKFFSKPEHHEVLRRFVKSLKPPMRLSRQALETLAVIAYRQPVTVPEIEEIRGVNAGGVIHTLMQKKLIVTSGRKNVIGRPILYRTSRDFLVHFGLKNLSELPSLKEFEELAREALGPEIGPAGLGPAETTAASSEDVPAPDGSVSVGSSEAPKPAEEELRTEDVPEAEPVSTTLSDVGQAEPAAEQVAPETVGVATSENAEVHRERSRQPAMPAPDLNDGTEGGKEREATDYVSDPAAAPPVPQSDVAGDNTELGKQREATDYDPDPQA
jgi:segregation and condensation protein B